MIARCCAAGKSVIVDPKGSDYSRYKGATLVKPTMKEFQEATGVTLNPSATGWERDAIAGAQRLFSEFGIENLLDVYKRQLLLPSHLRSLWTWRPRWGT